MSVKSTSLAQKLVWTLIAAAFIGPGTVTTAIAAGAAFDLQLAWVLGFSILACIILHETAARITIASGKDLSTIIFEGRNKIPAMMVVGSVVLGCMAYQSGNIAGAAQGIEILGVKSGVWFPVLLSLTGLFIFLRGGQRFLGGFMTLLVLVMVGAFALMSFKILSGSALNWVPGMPPGSELISIGLLGTTIVPYNLFLGSRLGHGQTLSGMRKGLITSIIIGGLISLAVMITGTSIVEMDFFLLSGSFENQIGTIGPLVLSIGLFAAGFTSTLTAPLGAKAAVSGATQGKIPKWIGALVFISGAFFASINLEPVPLIITAQALNGMILPVIAILLFVIANNPMRMGTLYLNNWWINGLSMIVIFFTILIGVNNINAALEKSLDIILLSDYLLVPTFGALLISLGVLIFTLRKRRKLTAR